MLKYPAKTAVNWGGRGMLCADAMAGAAARTAMAASGERSEEQRILRRPAGGWVGGGSTRVDGVGESCFPVDF